LRSADPKDNHHISFHHHTQVFGPNPTKFAMDLMREQNIQSAIDAVQNGATLRHAAQQFNVPRSTLSDRLRGATNRLAGQIEARKLLLV